VVGVVAPAGAVDADRLDQGVLALREWGFEVRLGGHIHARQGYLAGSDAQRLADLQGMVDDPLVRAIFCARGGYGVQRLVPDLHLDGLVRAPRPVIGYSDVSALLARLVSADLPAVHGPMIATDVARGLSDAAREHLLRLLGDPAYRWSLPVPETIRPGRAEALLVGGCLSVLASLLGTPWALRTSDTILFLEDVNEPPYRIDRLLTQLRQAGCFDHVAAVVFGALECPEAGGVNAKDVVRDFFADAPYPVAAGLAAGHTREDRHAENFALPLGVRARLDVGAGMLTGLEAMVS
jgi:muramoyltetrapeptide carboxypeptidase